MEKEIKKAMKIITNIAHAGDFENMKKVYMIYGIETVEKAIKVCNLLKDFTVPQIVMDVRGSVIPEFYSKIINDIKNASSFESQVAIARAYGLQSCVKATSQYKQK